MVLLPIRVFLAVGFAWSLAAITGRASAAEPALPFQNPALPIPARVDDLVGRLTLPEKTAQMMNNAPAIPRLGVAEYNWWSEALHGILTKPATVFPMPIGLAATFDTPLEARIGTAISDEARGWFNKTSTPMKSELFHGLTYFTPNINLFRDPRWGRGPETYGEDPYLTGRFAVAFIKALQGDDPRYCKIIATPKHYAVHSGPELERHQFDAQVSAYDLHDTYLPAFEAAVREGGAYGIMSAYSGLYGRPDSASPLLLETILRKRWGFRGFVISDLGAVKDIVEHHHFTKTMAEATAAAVRAGCDLTFFKEYDELPAAVAQGLITEAEIDVSLKRLFTARMKLGLFDPPADVPYSKISPDVIHSAAHRALALEAARKSIVLLKNTSQTLPLAKSIRSLAVIGPNADNAKTLAGTYNDGPSPDFVTVLAGVQKRAAASQIKVESVKGCEVSGANPNDLIPIPETALHSDQGQPGLHAEYFANRNLDGAPVTARQEAMIDDNWAAGGPPPNCQPTEFSARWTGKLTAAQAGEYTLAVRGDDGFRLFLDGEKVLDEWSVHAPKTSMLKRELQAGQTLAIRIEYFQAEKGAELSLRWRAPGKVDFSEAIAAARRADAVIFVGGISSLIEGEEGTRPASEGGGDRADLELPKVQADLLAALATTGKPIVFVLMSGSAVAIPWAQQNLPAILTCWYPGEAGGTAVADVLFGDYNPAGRLPVTFYQSAAQLPDFHDYAMKNRTYRYFTGEPLYPFGFGLSFTRFAYRDLEMPETVKRGEPAMVRVRVENVGDRDGEEVVELFLRPAPDADQREISPGQPMPRLLLAGFQRVPLARQESRVVEFQLTPEQLLLVNAEGERQLQPGAWEVFLGGGPPSMSLAPPEPGTRLSGVLTVR